MNNVTHYFHYMVMIFPLHSIHLGLIRLWLIMCCTIMFPLVFTSRMLHAWSQEVDGVVADLTMTSDRLRLVDFTQPYIQSSLQMIVPLQSRSEVRFWIFLTPFSWQLWIIIIALFIVTILAIFIVEYYGRAHEPNEYWGNALSQSFRKRIPCILLYSEEVNQLEFQVKCTKIIDQPQEIVHHSSKRSHYKLGQK